jgi:hypothetical protein
VTALTLIPPLALAGLWLWLLCRGSRLAGDVLGWGYWFCAAMAVYEAVDMILDL